MKPKSKKVVRAIRRWAFDQEITLAEIAREAGVCRNLVSLVIRGMRGNGFKAERVIRIMKERGCPPELLESEEDQTAA